MTNRPTAQSPASSVRRNLHNVRRRVDIALCRRRVKSFPAEESVSGIVSFALRERAIAVQQVPSEIMAFAKLVEELAPKTILEIGTSRGGSLFILLQAQRA